MSLFNMSMGNFLVTLNTSFSWVMLTTRCMFAKGSLIYDNDLRLSIFVSGFCSDTIM